MTKNKPVHCSGERRNNLRRQLDANEAVGDPERAVWDNARWGKSAGALIYRPLTVTPPQFRTQSIRPPGKYIFLFNICLRSTLVFSALLLDHSTWYSFEKDWRFTCWVIWGSTTHWPSEIPIRLVILILLFIFSYFWESFLYFIFWRMVSSTTIGLRPTHVSS